MPFTCAFSNGFDSGFEICPTDEAQPDPRTLRGVPSAVPRPRKRPDVREVAGFGLVPVIGAGSITAEAHLASTLDIEVAGTGVLTLDRLGLLIGAIAQGAEGLISREYALSSSLSVSIAGAGGLSRDAQVGGEGVQRSIAEGRLARDHAVSGLAPIRTGAEGLLTSEENEEALILMAAMLIVKLLNT